MSEDIIPRVTLKMNLNLLQNFQHSVEQHLHESKKLMKFIAKSRYHRHHPTLSTLYLPEIQVE